MWIVFNLQVPSLKGIKLIMIKVIMLRVMNGEKLIMIVIIK